MPCFWLNLSAQFLLKNASLLTLWLARSGKNYLVTYKEKNIRTILIMKKMTPILYRYPEPPEQPPDNSWPFEDELQKPIHLPIKLGPVGHGRNELDFHRGVHLVPDFPDPQGLLQTAYRDFKDFLKSIGLNDAGPCPIIATYASTSRFEEYRIIVARDRIAILSADTEGIRRGLIHLEDMILTRGACSLPISVTERKPVIRTRISRCFYGPINRPPKCRDELNDDVNYYPDGYLNRLAHNGINGLWLTITFRDTCPSKIIPEYGRDSERRLNKLRATVKQCARYGIKIYPFCIEPASFPVNSPILKAHPELKGATNGKSAFCTSTDTGRAYLEEATHTLFSLVPGLGGLIVIPVGERLTHCYSGSWSTNCPRCSKRKPSEVLADTMAALERGLRAVAPNADLIAWPYGQLILWGPKLMVAAAACLPKNVILQHNFETGGKARQLGKWRPLWDYWLSWAGPSKVFSDCTRAARKNKTRVFAKLQTSCSHEVATTQYVPVPGLIYQKYRMMHNLGVSGAMQGWYFGNYPSLMTKAAAMLSFAPFPKTEREFLLALARRDWGNHASEIAQAWKYFQKGYEQYPAEHVFGYYGPMHDGVVWPLYLEPRHLPLSPTWQLCYPPSGDQVGECVSSYFNYNEILTLGRRMRDNWRKGMKILHRLAPYCKHNEECRQNVSIAAALELQFESGFNILLFYYLRDRLATANGLRQKTNLLKKMRRIVEDEIGHDKALRKLCRQDRRLGFHSEAEGYKYYPAKITWRVNQLKSLLRNEFPRVEKQIRDGALLFPDYIGQGPSIQAYQCLQIKNGAELSADPFSPKWDECQPADCAYWLAHREPVAGRPTPYGNPLEPVAPAKAPPSQISWRSAFDQRVIYICADCPAGSNEGTPPESAGDCVQVVFEPNRLGSRILFVVNRNGNASAVIDDGYISSVPSRWKARVGRRGNDFRIVLAVPFACLGLAAPHGKTNPRIRANVSLCFAGKPLINSWAKVHPAMGRLIFGYLHPANYGWLIFEGIRQ